MLQYGVHTNVYVTNLQSAVTENNDLKLYSPTPQTLLDERRHL